MATTPSTLTQEERDRIVARLRTLGRLMDDQVQIPGTNLRFGLDPLLGLIPGVGDVLSTGISAYIVYEARRLGVSRRTLARMVANVLMDMAVGAVPLVGDIADFGFKANRRNLRLLGITTEEPGRTREGGRYYRVVAEQ